MSVYENIIAERARQILAGYNAAHDDVHTREDLCALSAAYSLAYDMDLKHLEAVSDHARFVSPSCDMRRNMVIAAALLVAAIERMDRAQ